MKKNVVTGVISIALAIVMAGCSATGVKETVDGGGGTPVSEAPKEEAIGGNLKSVPIVFDRSCGQAEENIQIETINSYEDVTPEEVIAAMSEITGLNFNVTFSEKDDGVNVDWALDSTLIANLGEGEQKEDFFFFDAESMRWFMMDSMMRTLNENGISVVYYTMDGGKELAFDELYPVNVFPCDVPYMGSPFYYAHADVIGDSDVAMDILAQALGDKMEEKTLVDTGEAEINGEMCKTFSLGINHPDNFVAEEHFAVSPEGEIYTMDILQDSEWIIYNSQN